MDHIDSPFTEPFTNGPLPPLDRWKTPEGPLPQLGPHDACIVKLYSKRLLSLSERYDVKSQQFSFVGVDVYPENLSVFSSELTRDQSSTKAECIFFIRDAFLCTDLKVEISIPGGTKLYVCDQYGEPRDVRTEDLDRCYVSSVLRYMNAFQHNAGKGFMTDPFGDDMDRFNHFLSSLCRITRSEDIELRSPAGYEQLDRNYRLPLKVLAKYVKMRKLDAWIRQYYFNCEVDAASCIKKSPHLVQFYLDVFLASGDIKIVSSILFSDDIEQVIARPMVNYYLAKTMKTRDDQLFLLKSISYTNKADVWLALVQSYLNTRYSNFGMLSKSLLILNHLSIKKDGGVPPVNPLSIPQKPLPLKRSIEYLPELSGYPQGFKCLHNRNKTLGKECQAADSSLLVLRQLMDKYFALGLLKREITIRVSRILKALGRQKFSVLYAHSFQSFKINMDSIYFKPVEPQPVELKEQEPIDLDAEHEQFPSFIAAELEDRVVYVKDAEGEASQVPMTAQHDDFQDLARITEENLITEREYKSNLDEIAKRKATQELPLRRFINNEFEQLVRLAMDIRHCVDEIVKKLGIDPTRIESLKNLVLSTEHSMVMAQAAFLCGHMLIAAYMHISIKKRIVDLYAYHRLLRIMPELKDFNGVINQITDIITDFKTIGIADLEHLPLWIEEELFNLLDRKGKIYVETLMKPSKLKEEACVSNSLMRYQEIRRK